MFWTLVRTVPRTAALGPLVAAAGVATVSVLTASSSSAAPRFRFGAAVVAAASCFVLDDDAALTLAAAPVSRAVRRLARFVVAASCAMAWLVAVVVAGDVLVGLGRPSAAAVAEVGALVLVAAAGACVAMGRSDDGRGGITGAGLALLCSATAYLPARVWLPLTPQPELMRLCVIGLAAIGVALTASADPARRRRIAL